MPPLSAAAGADVRKFAAPDRPGSMKLRQRVDPRLRGGPAGDHGLLFHAAHKGKVNVLTPPSEVMIKRLGEAGVIARGNLDAGFDHAYLPPSTGVPKTLSVRW
jgi:hypothetical protein